MTLKACGLVRCAAGRHFLIFGALAHDGFCVASWTGPGRNEHQELGNSHLSISIHLNYNYLFASLLLCMSFHSRTSTARHHARFAQPCAASHCIDTCPASRHISCLFFAHICIPPLQLTRQVCIIQFAATTRALLADPHRSSLSRPAAPPAQNVACEPTSLHANTPRRSAKRLCGTACPQPRPRTAVYLRGKGAGLAHCMGLHINALHHAMHVGQQNIHIEG